MMRCDSRSRGKILMPIDRHNNSSDGKGSSGAPFFGGRQLLKNDLFLKNEKATPTSKNMYSLQQTIYMEKKMGEMLGRSDLLLQCL